MKRVALLVDHPRRDLAGLVLVATRLCADGVASFLVPARLAQRELPGLAPDVAVLNHLRHLDVARVRLLTDIGSRLAVLDVEGGVLENLDAYRRGLAGSEVRSAVERYFTWGPRLAQAAVAEGWFSPQQLAVTGHPRFDYYQAPWREAVLASFPERSEPRRPMILLVGSFPLANPRFLSVEEEVELLVSHARQERAVVERRLETERRALRSLADLANRLAEALPRARVVVRPHPFERAETYRELLAGGVEVGEEGAAIDWILRASAVVQRGSTLAVEAAMAGVAVLSPEWLPDWSRADWIRQLSSACHDEIELVARLEEAIASGRGSARLGEDSVRLMDDWFFRRDGCAHERVADGLRELVEQVSAVDRRRARAHVTGARGAGLSPWRRAVGTVRLAARVPADFSLARFGRMVAEWPWDDGSRTFTVEEVRRQVDQLLTCGMRAERGVEVAACHERGDYLLPNRLGRSIAIAPTRSALG